MADAAGVTDRAIEDAHLADIHRAQQIEGCDTTDLHEELRRILRTGVTPRSSSRILWTGPGYPPRRIPRHGGPLPTAGSGPAPTSTSDTWSCAICRV